MIWYSLYFDGSEFFSRLNSPWSLEVYNDPLKFAVCSLSFHRTLKIRIKQWNIRISLNFCHLTPTLKLQQSSYGWICAWKIFFTAFRDAWILTNFETTFLRLYDTVCFKKYLYHKREKGRNYQGGAIIPPSSLQSRSSNSLLCVCLISD